MTDKEFKNLLAEHNIEIEGDNLKGTTTNFSKLFEDRFKQLAILSPDIDNLGKESTKH